MSSPLSRLAAASVVGLIAAALVLGIAVALDGSFFQPKEQMAVIPCYFTAPDPSAVADAAPGAPLTATGCLPQPEHDPGVAGFFAKMMGRGPGAAPGTPMLDQPPRSERRP